MCVRGYYINCYQHEDEHATAKKKDSTALKQVCCFCIFGGKIAIIRTLLLHRQLCGKRQYQPQDKPIAILA